MNVHLQRWQLGLLLLLGGSVIGVTILRARKRLASDPASENLDSPG